MRPGKVSGETAGAMDSPQVVAARDAGAVRWVGGRHFAASRKLFNYVAFNAGSHFCSSDTSGVI